MGRIKETILNDCKNLRNSEVVYKYEDFFSDLCELASFYISYYDDNITGRKVIMGDSHNTQMRNEIANDIYEWIANGDLLNEDLLDAYTLAIEYMNSWN